MEESEQIRKWEDERLELIRASGSGGVVLFWMGGIGFFLCVLEAWTSGASSSTGFGLAASIGLLGWAVFEHDKKATAERKLRVIDAYLEHARKPRP